jgi:hypothetical protein
LGFAQKSFVAWVVTIVGMLNGIDKGYGLNTSPGTE